MTVADNQLTESAETLQGLVAMLPSVFLANWGVDLSALSIATRDLLGLPDEVLDQVAIVLGQKENLGLLNDFAQISNELLALG